MLSISDLLEEIIELEFKEYDKVIIKYWLSYLLSLGVIQILLKINNPPSALEYFLLLRIFQVMADIFSNTDVFIQPIIYREILEEFPRQTLSSFCWKTANLPPRKDLNFRRRLKRFGPPRDVVSPSPLSRHIIINIIQPPQLI